MNNPPGPDVGSLAHKLWAPEEMRNAANSRFEKVFHPIRGIAWSNSRNFRRQPPIPICRGLIFQFLHLIAAETSHARVSISDHQISVTLLRFRMPCEFF